MPFGPAAAAAACRPPRHSLEREKMAGMASLVYFRVIRQSTKEDWPWGAIHDITTHFHRQCQFAFISHLWAAPFLWDFRHCVRWYRYLKDGQVSQRKGSTVFFYRQEQNAVGGHHRRARRRMKMRGGRVLFGWQARI